MVKIDTILDYLLHTLIRFTNVPNVDTGDEVSENKDSVSLTESITFWQLSIAGTCLQVTDDNVSVFLAGREGAIDCLLHQSSKFYSSVFLFVGLSTLETFIEF